MARKHLLVAPSGAAFGEIQQGLLLGRQLVARGEAVTLFAPKDAAVLVPGSGVEHLANDAEVPVLASATRRLMEKGGFASLTLVDATACGLAFETLGTDLRFLDALPAPVVALDYWNLHEAGLIWDFGTDATAIPSKLLDIERRLVPVPVVRPMAGRAAYCAMPAREPSDRTAARAEFGLGATQRVVLFAQSRWQLPDVQNWKHHARVARHLPPLLLRRLARLGDDVHLLHVGPEAWDGAVLGSRYHWLDQMPPERFRALLSAADLFLSANATGTTTVAAMAEGVPILLARNSYRGKTVEEVEERVGHGLHEDVRTWLAGVAPLYPFRLWPLGLSEFLGPVLKDNPYLDGLREVEIVDEDGFLRAAEALLFDPAVASELRERQAAYGRRVAELPSAADVFLSYF